MAVFKDEDFTEWFGPEFIPGQAGVFQITLRDGGVILFSHWDGKKYSTPAFSPNGAAQASHRPGTRQDVWFRGLKKDWRPNETNTGRRNH